MQYNATNIDRKHMNAFALNKWLKMRARAYTTHFSTLYLSGAIRDSLETVRVFLNPNRQQQQQQHNKPDEGAEPFCTDVQHFQYKPSPSGRWSNVTSVASHQAALSGTPADDTELRLWKKTDPPPALPKPRWVVFSGIELKPKMESSKTGLSNTFTAGVSRPAWWEGTHEGVEHAAGLGIFGFNRYLTRSVSLRFLFFSFTWPTQQHHTIKYNQTYSKVHNIHIRNSIFIESGREVE